MKLKILPLALCLSCLAGVASAEGTPKKNPQDFKLNNASDRPVYYLYVSPVNAKTWEKDVLGRDAVLFPGKKINVEMSGYPDDKCEFDVLVIDDTENKQEMRGLNLCDLEQVTYDK